MLTTAAAERRLGSKKHSARRERQLSVCVGHTQVSSSVCEVLPGCTETHATRATEPPRVTSLHTVLTEARYDKRPPRCGHYSCRRLRVTDSTQVRPGCPGACFGYHFARDSGRYYRSMRLLHLAGLLRRSCPQLQSLFSACASSAAGQRASTQQTGCGACAVERVSKVC